MLSSTLLIVDGCKVGEHPLVCHLMKEIFNSRLPVRSLFPSWEIYIVLDHVRAWDHPSRLSLGDLTKKTVFLLAIVLVKRVAFLNNFSIALGMVDMTSTSIRFTPVLLEKHNRPDFLMQPLKVRKFEDTKLDPVLHIKTYISRTKLLHTSQRLFVTINKPHGMVAKATIARWIKDIISSSNQSGRGGSCRSVSSSKAATSSKISTKAILEAGEWTRESMFRKYYNKASCTYDRAVLKTRSQN